MLLRHVASVVRRCDVGERHSRSRSSSGITTTTSKSRPTAATARKIDASSHIRRGAPQHAGRLRQSFPWQQPSPCRRGGGASRQCFSFRVLPDRQRHAARVSVAARSGQRCYVPSRFRNGASARRLLPRSRPFGFACSLRGATEAAPLASRSTSRCFATAAAALTCSFARCSAVSCDAQRKV